MVGLPLSVVTLLVFRGVFQDFIHKATISCFHFTPGLKRSNVNLSLFHCADFPLEVAQVGAHLSNSRLGSVAPEIGLREGFWTTTTARIILQTNSQGFPAHFCLRGLCTSGYQK